jgi:hypothetical protein
MRDDVLERLRAHPLYKKSIEGLSEAERLKIEETVESFVDQLSSAFVSVASRAKAEAAKPAGISGSLGT